MTITLNKVSKRFDREWIFKNLSYTFSSGKSYAILGPNGSGKSTLMKLLSGSLSATSGEINYQLNHGEVGGEDVFENVSFCAPYLQMIEEMTITESVNFHFRFKKLFAGVQQDDVLKLLMLDGHQDKQLSQLSSGMMQRLKVGLALLSEAAVVLLDEPATNLDEVGVAWYADLIANYTANRLVVVSSNRPEEYDFCVEQLLITDFK